MVWGWGRGCGTHQHHDPSISFGALEAVQSWATLKPTEDALVNPLPTGQPGPRVLSHIQSEEQRHLQVVRGGQTLLCVLVVLWAPRGKTNTNWIRKQQTLKRQGDGGTPPASVGSGEGEPLTGGGTTKSKYGVSTCLAPCLPASLCLAGTTCSIHHHPAPPVSSTPSQTLHPILSDSQANEGTQVASCWPAQNVDLCLRSYVPGLSTSPTGIMQPCLPPPASLTR